MPIVPIDRDLIRAAIDVLHCPRNRFGKIEPTTAARECIQGHMLRLKASGAQFPHGGEDTPDQIAMILQVFLGETPTSSSP